MAVRGDLDVLGFQIAVDDAFFVCGVEGFGGLSGYVDDVVEGERSVF